MILLPPDFQLDKYGMSLRLVQENDADFIVKLRSDTKKARFIHSIDNDVQKQIEWIREYKKREQQGSDYYFIYFDGDTPIGLNRLYDINGTTFTGGSFVFVNDCRIELPALSVLIQFDIAFNMLHLETNYGDIRLGNKKVIKFHKLLQVTFTTTDELNQYYVYTKEQFNSVKPKLEKYLLG